MEDCMGGALWKRSILTIEQQTLRVTQKQPEQGCFVLLLEKENAAKPGN